MNIGNQSWLLSLQKDEDLGMSQQLHRSVPSVWNAPLLVTSTGHSSSYFTPLHKLHLLCEAHFDQLILTYHHTPYLSPYLKNNFFSTTITSNYAYIFLFLVSPCTTV